ncbi:hypothetical protein ASD97_20940 [Streptomyces sp. Root63]|uniref:hypothetical protein n=1 Tax=unclassified Streptomyces TaxID=2593676 RepID=UPI0006FB4DC2|nr:MULTISPECIES: hypothetical protein [unclassified Streptomyces]KQX36543.1 hypothetical protein ASD29_04585 [Streptomyces sp. Root1295]KRA36649.1 hypothetical protein ASD97_20940 [Streptomyces sp. Root63]
MITLIRTRILDDLRTDLTNHEADARAARAKGEQHELERDLATNAANRAEVTVEELRDALTRATQAAARLEGELETLRAQSLLDTEDRQALRTLLRTTRKQNSRADRVYVLFHHGRLHSVHPTAEAAEIAAEAEGAPRSNWTTHTPGAAMPPACEVTWRVQPLPFGTTTP